MNFTQLEETLRTYSLKEAPYDPNGAIHLLKAIVENLQDHFTDDDFENYSACLDEKNEAFLKKLLVEISRSREATEEI